MRARSSAFNAGEWSFFPDLLVAALKRAVALAQMNGIAHAVAEHLDLDVAGFFEILLDIDRIVAKGRTCFGARRLQRLDKVGLAARDLHAATAAAGRRLDDDRIADLGCYALGFAFVRDCAVGPWNDRNAEALCRALGLDLVAHDADVVTRRADEGDVVGRQYVGELGVFRQEAVARMYCVCAGDLAGRDDLVNVEIAVARRRRSDADAFVGKPDMHGVGVGGRMDHDRLDAELLARTQHPEGDFAAIGDEDFLEHLRVPELYSITTSGMPFQPAAHPRTGSP